VPEDEIIAIESDLTLLGGKVVWGTGSFSKDAPEVPPPAPDWSPVRAFGGYFSRKTASRNGYLASVAARCGCASACAVHGHAHMAAASRDMPVSDAASFWGALGCACWAV
jgi:hypothetical protein